VGRGGVQRRLRGTEQALQGQYHFFSSEGEQFISFCRKQEEVLFDSTGCVKYHKFVVDLFNKNKAEAADGLIDKDNSMKFMDPDKKTLIRRWHGMVQLRLRGGQEAQESLITFFK
jgi:hypothetical protein